MSRYIEQHLTRGERVIYQAKPSLWGYLGWIVFGCVMLTAVPIGTAMGVVILAVVWLRYTSTELAFTNKRLIAKTGIISRSTIEMQLARVESVQVSQSVFGRMLDYGTVVVSGAGNPQAPIANISSPMAFRKALLEQQDDTHAMHGMSHVRPTFQDTQPTQAAGNSEAPPDKDSWGGYLYDEPSVRRATMPVLLDYTDAQGQRTRRQVDITAYSPHERGMVLGRCHLRNANRTFLFERINRATDAETGEVLPSLLAELNKRWQASPEASMDTLLAEHADVLKLLLFTAKADGQMRAAEVAVITRMCKTITADDRITPAMVKAMLGYMGTPSITSFVRIYNAMRRDDVVRANQVADACRQIIATQKHVHPSEQALLNALEKPLKP